MFSRETEGEPNERDKETKGASRMRHREKPQKREREIGVYEPRQSN